MAPLNCSPHGVRAEAWQGAAGGAGQLRTADPDEQPWVWAGPQCPAGPLAGSMAAPRRQGQPA